VLRVRGRDGHEQQQQAMKDRRIVGQARRRRRAGPTCQNTSTRRHATRSLGDRARQARQLAAEQQRRAASALTTTAIAERQPKWLSMYRCPSATSFATISTGGAA
jgi:hypothetical protein